MITQGPALEEEAFTYFILCRCGIVKLHHVNGRCLTRPGWFEVGTFVSCSLVIINRWRSDGYPY